mmetsp:Transcript_16401/g.20463  ORF Transcript_16401/g.20463 Transcript_16401/m.20463 type:complete len:127 (+) Transcript_16401:772-1152(+)
MCEAMMVPILMGRSVMGTGMADVGTAIVTKVFPRRDIQSRPRVPLPARCSVAETDRIVATLFLLSSVAALITFCCRCLSIRFVSSWVEVTTGMWYVSKMTLVFVGCAWFIISTVESIVSTGNDIPR